MPPRQLASWLDVLSARKKDLLFGVVLAAIPVLFLANVLFTDQVLVGDNLWRFPPWRTYASEELRQRPSNRTLDPLLSYYPRRIVAAEIVRSGDLPLWNPYSLAGSPFIASVPGVGFFYPLNIIYYLVDPLKGFGLSGCVHLFLAGLFMYLYLRSIQLDRMSAFFGAVSFQISGYFLVNLMWLGRIVLAAWAPLLFFCLEKYWSERRWIHAILLALTVGICILTGEFAIFAFVMLGFGLYSVLKFFLGISEQGLGEAAKTMAVVLVAVGLGILLAAVQLIPFYEVSRFSERAHWSYEDLLDRNRSPLSLATALVPDVFGNPVDPIWLVWGTRPGDYFGKSVPGNYARSNIYSGILPLVLAACALVFTRNRYVFFFGGLAILSLSLFLTFPSLIYRILFTIPVFRVGRPMEVKVMYAFSLCVLGAWGFGSAMEELKQRNRSRMSTASIVLLVIGMAVLLGVMTMRFALGRSDVPDLLREWCIYNVPNFVRFAMLLLACGVLLLVRVREKIGAHLFGLFAIILVVADMFCFGWKFNPPQESEDLLFETDSVRFLISDRDRFRIIRISGGGREVLPPNTPSVYGISDAQGYTPVMLGYYADYVELIEPNIVGTETIGPLSNAGSLSSGLLDLLNVKYILSNARVSEELLRFDEDHQDIQLVYDEEIKIYENKDVLPRAFVVHEFKVLREKEHILAELTSDGFDPRTRVILEEEPLGTLVAPRSSAANSAARILHYTPNKVVIEVDTASDGFLVLGDIYYEGWKAFVDGANEKVYKADYIFRAVEVTRGQHIVDFVFDPLSFRVGLCISVMASTAMCAFVIVGFVSRHRSRGR